MTRCVMMSDPAAAIARDDSERCADHDAKQARAEADHQRNARAVDQARKNVAPESVGAEPIGAN